MSAEEVEYSLHGNPADPAFVGTCIEKLFNEVKVLRASNEILMSGLLGVLAAYDIANGTTDVRYTGPARNQMKEWIRIAQEKLGQHPLFTQMESQCGKDYDAMKLRLVPTTKTE